MKDDFAPRFTGAAFVAAALLLWLGWFLLPVRPGTYFEPETFGRIHEQFRFWIWMYRFHIFGMIMAVVGLTALAALVTESPERVLIWPGAMVAAAGLFVSALGGAFYYHHGAWGSVELAGHPPEAAQAFVEALRVDTEYVTCLVRFGRVFGGLGLLLLAGGLIRGRLLPSWTAIVAGLIGVASMGLTMMLPDNLSYFLPVFHLFALWLLGTGFVIFRGGLQTAQ